MITKPLLFRSDLDWNLLFMDKELKLFAFNVFSVALLHAAASMFASKELLPDATVKVWAPDGSAATATATTIKQQKAPSVSKLYCKFGEGDLRCFGNMLDIMHSSKKPVVVHSIDTDFLLMTLATSVWFKPMLPAPVPFFLVLSEGVYNGTELQSLFRSKNEADCLNTAFWAMAFGTDYSNPLTNNGYFNNDLKKLMHSHNHCRKPITVLDDKRAQFDLKKALFVLKPLRCTFKKNNKDSVKDTLLKMLFCLQYYGLMFVSDETPLFGKKCILDKNDTVIFNYKPDTKKLFT